MGKIYVIPILPLLEVNHHQPILHMPKILVYLYTTDKSMNLFAIGHMINHKLHVSKFFIEQVEKCLRSTFNQNTTVGIQNDTRKKDTCVIELIMFIE